MASDKRCEMELSGEGRMTLALQAASGNANGFSRSEEGAEWRKVLTFVVKVET